MKNSSVAIVTGASQGIGRATALRLARDFSAVVLAREIRMSCRGRLRLSPLQVPSRWSARSICASISQQTYLSAEPSIISVESMPCSTSPELCRKSICSK